MKIQLSDHFTYRRLLSFCASPILMLVFVSIYGVVDGLFISNFVGKNSFVAVNLVIPFTMMLGGMCFMVGTGGAALVSKTLGEGDSERANRYFSMMVQLTVWMGLTLTVLGIVFMRPVCRMLGAGPELMEDCVLYGRTVLLFNVAFMVQNIFQNFLSVAERPKLGLIATVAAGCTNMVLDALFVAIFRWGVLGAAIATGISQCIGAVIPLVYFLRPNDSLLYLKPAKMELRPILRSCGNGASELVTNISVSIVSILYNWQLIRYSGDNGVAAYGVLMYVQFTFISVFFGYTLGASPVVGYHFGAQNHGEVKNVLNKSMVLNGTIGLLMTTTALVLAKPIAMIFVGYDPDLLEMTTRAFRIFAFSFFFAGINIYTSSFFTALNNGTVSAIISFSRTMIFQISSVLILPLLWGVDGIWISITVAEILALILSILFLLANRKKYHY